MTADLKNFYYMIPMSQYEYMRMPIAMIPQEIINQYNLHILAHGGWIYMEIRKGMP